MSQSNLEPFIEMFLCKMFTQCMNFSQGVTFDITFKLKSFNLNKQTPLQILLQCAEIFRATCLWTCPGG